MSAHVCKMYFGGKSERRGSESHGWGGTGGGGEGRGGGSGVGGSEGGTVGEGVKQQTDGLNWRRNNQMRQKEG